MRNKAATTFKVSMVVMVGGAIVASTLVSNCGGSTATRTGTAGATGSAGTGAGTAGTSGGTAGTSGGTAGNTGTGGVVLNTCTMGGVLDCTAAATVSDGVVSSFSAEEWSNNAGKWCADNGLRGSIFSYQGGPTPDDGGVPSMGASSVDTAAHNFKATFTVAPGGYAGAGISFDSCVNVGTAFNALQFTTTLTGGDFTGCVWKVQLQTQEQRPTTQTSPPGGTCDPDAGSCYNFPAVTLAIPTATTFTETHLFTEFAPATTGAPLPQQMVGIQFQVESGPGVDGGAQIPCSAEVRIDDVKFVTQ